MTWCAVCTRHVLDQGEHTDRCRHNDATLGNLCGVCAQRIRDDLDAIVAALDCSPPSHGPGSRSGERALPGGTEWLDWRQGAELLGVLESWCRCWHEDVTTDDAAPVWPRRTIVDMCRWLRAMLEQFGAGHEAIADMADELAAWGRRARRLTGDLPAGHVAPCPCGRRLRVDAADMDATVKCVGCGAKWTVRSLVIQAGDDDAWLDPDAIEAWTGVHPRTLRRWAAAGKVEREHGLYRVGSVRAAAAVDR